MTILEKMNDQLEEQEELAEPSKPLSTAGKKTLAKKKLRKSYMVRPTRTLNGTAETSRRTTRTPRKRRRSGGCATCGN